MVRDTHGFVARIDLAYPAPRVAIELDGYEAHRGVEAFRRDRARQNRLVLLDWTVLRFTWGDVVEEPGTVVGTLTGALAN